jgi:hypothetical protein
MPPTTKLLEGELIDPVRDEAVAILSRAWVVLRHMQGVQIAMGEVEVVEHKEVAAEDGRKTIITIRKTSHNSVAAHRHLKALTAELDRRDANPAPPARDDNPATTRAVDRPDWSGAFAVMQARKVRQTETCSRKNFIKVIKYSGIIKCDQKCRPRQPISDHQNHDPENVARP